MKINCKTSQARRSIICCAVDFQENAFSNWSDPRNEKQYGGSNVMIY